MLCGAGVLGATKRNSYSSLKTAQNRERCEKTPSLQCPEPLSGSIDTLSPPAHPSTHPLIHPSTHLSTHSLGRDRSHQLFGHIKVRRDRLHIVEVFKGIHEFDQQAGLIGVIDHNGVAGYPAQLGLVNR